MGKSELVAFMREQARSQQTTVVDISKDAVARPLMDVFHKQNPDVPFTDIFMTIFPQILATFKSEIFRALANLKPGKNILVIDDAWTDATIMAGISSPDTAPGYSKRVICVYPKISEQHFHDNLPFSLQFIVNICHRVVTRPAHDTMVYDDVKKVQIVLSFVKLYAGISHIPTRFQQESAAYEFYPVEFHQEADHSDTHVPELVSKLYTQTALCFERLGAPFETPFVQGRSEVERLVSLLAQLDRDSNPALHPFLNFGRKAEWEKWFGQVANLLG